MECSKKSFLQVFLRDYYAPALLSVPGKIISLLLIAGLFGVGVYGCVELEQDFDFTWFLPTDSSPRQYTTKDEIAFPNDGFQGNVYFGKIDYYEHYTTIDDVVNSLKSDKFVVTASVNSWYHLYQDWTMKNHRDKLLNCTVGKKAKNLGDCRTTNRTVFLDLMGAFLNGPQGRFAKSSLKIDNNTKEILATKISYTHVKFAKAADEIKGMDSVQAEINNKKITVDPEPLLPFAYAFFYIGWETNKVITEELVRNLGLALLCVFLVTLFLLSNLLTSILVLVCVALALCDIAGFMGFWGLTIDTVTTIILVIAIGLTVDYSAHIGHAFMAARKGDKNARMRHGLAEVGPAVVNGGFSTFLAFVLLAASNSYVFSTFFRVFFLVVLFGMLHGFVFLPVMLSLIGPRPYANHNDDDDGDREKGHRSNQQNGASEVKMEEIASKNNVKNGGGETNKSYVTE